MLPLAVVASELTTGATAYGGCRSSNTNYQLSTLAVESDRAVDGGASSPSGTKAIAFRRRSFGGFHMGCDQCISPFAVRFAYSSSVSCIAYSRQIFTNLSISLVPQNKSQTTCHICSWFLPGHARTKRSRLGPRSLAKTSQCSTIIFL